MKRIMFISVSALLLLSSCGSYTASGAYTGATFGSIIGSAIGGLSGGHRGSDLGTLIGMAGGAAVGAAVGQAADQAEQQKYEEYKAERQRRNSNYNNRGYNDNGYDDRSYDDRSGFDPTNSGDDRLYGWGENLSTADEVTVSTLEMRNALEIRNARLLDANGDGVLKRGEEARMVFEIYNNTKKPIYRVQPSVAEVTGNKHIHISENILVESIAPGMGVRYTANIKADNYLRNGEAVIRIGVLQNNREITSQTKDFNLRTSKK